MSFFKLLNERKGILGLSLLNFPLFILALFILFGLSSFGLAIAFYYFFTVVIFFRILIRGVEKHSGYICWKILAGLHILFYSIGLPVFVLGGVGPMGVV